MEDSRFYSEVLLDKWCEAVSLCWGTDFGLRVI